MVRTKGTRLFIFIFLAIPVIHLMVFSYIPIISNIYLSFTNYNGVNPPKWVGLRNYERLLPIRSI